MISFDDVYKLTDSISHETAFSREESQFYYDLLCALPDHASVLEIGCQYGRSTSILAQVGKEKHFDIHLCDNYAEAESRQAMLTCMGMLHDVGVEFTLYKMYSAVYLPDRFPYCELSLILIDGDHSFAGVHNDLLSYDMRGKILAFHDYGRESLPDIERAVTQYPYIDQRECIGIHGTLAAFRRRV